MGIAILDSGVMKAHNSFQNAAGVSRVKRSVDMLKGTLNNWSEPWSGNSSPQPGSAALNSYEAALAADTAVTHDAYRHGTHVASIAAGRGVMNISLAAQSTESYDGDPLCDAVRMATAMGITVVVAGGNFGLMTNGKEVYGSIASPGHEPSVITVGAVNFGITTGRGDDKVNFFSSRGPHPRCMDRTGYANRLA